MNSEEAWLKQEITELQDLLHGRDRHSDELPDELARRRGRLENIEAARKRLEERDRAGATQQAARPRVEGRSLPATSPDGSVVGTEDQINFTVPVSWILKESKRPQGLCSNAQIVTNGHQGIRAADVIDQASDLRQSVSMVGQANATLYAANGMEVIKEALSDAGYYGGAKEAGLEQPGSRTAWRRNDSSTTRMSRLNRESIPEGLMAMQ